MDLISHGLWTNIVWQTDKKAKKDALWAVLFGILPDLIHYSYDIFLTIFTDQKPFILQKNGLFYHFKEQFVPNQTFLLQNLTHSLVIFFIALIIITALRRGKIWLPILAWSMHIFMDIPTHGTPFTSTPFFYPFKAPIFFGGIAWNNPYFLILNYFLLTAAYFRLYIFHKRKTTGLKSIKVN